MGLTLLPSTKLKWPDKLLWNKDEVEVKPLGPPLNFTPYVTFEWDYTKLKLEQRRLKIDKIRSNICQCQCSQDQQGQ